MCNVSECTVDHENYHWEGADKIFMYLLKQKNMHLYALYYMQSNMNIT